jgi:hypothetical protein
MFTRLLTVIFPLLVVFSLANAQTPAPADVHVKLSLAENKTVYRIGEPIKLLMEFTADKAGYKVEYLSEQGALTSDSLVISPDIGYTYWLDEMNNNIRYMRDYFAEADLSSTPKQVVLVLNDALRFDNPGRYTVSVTTRRVRPTSSKEDWREPLTLSTNSVKFEIQPMSEADEETELKRLTQLLDAKRDWQSEDAITKQLSYLAGDPSSREKVRRLLDREKRSGNYYANILTGLFIARNRALVLKLIENALRDPEIPATAQLLGVATRLKTLLVQNVSNKPVVVGSVIVAPAVEEDSQTKEIREGYLLELAAGLGKRTGESQTTTAQTIFTSFPKNAQTPPSPALREARRILIQQFDTLDLFGKEWLLRSYWEDLRDPVLLNSLKKMLASSDPRMRGLHGIVLTRLLEMAPDEARSYVIAEIRDPGSFVDPTILSALKDESLPEVDAPLLEQLRRFTQQTQNRDIVSLKTKSALLARFATDSVYPDVMELYRTTRERLYPDARGAFLAYLAKHNEREALPLIEQAVAELKPGEDPAVLRELTSHYYSAAIGAVVKKLLETNDAASASHAAYLIGLHGVAGDEKVLEARLNRWHDEWKDRVIEADAQQQGRIERELIWALLNGNTWTLSPERVRELQQSCVTKICKQSPLVRTPK